MTRVLISGAGVAGPALALSLARHGIESTVVEAAPRLRTSGFAVDFRGPTHLGVLERLGVLDDLRAQQTHGSAMACVDENGREIFRLPAEFTGGELEVLRSDLSATLVRHSGPSTTYVFNDSITELLDGPDGVHVTFERGADATFDVVIGADGMHSAVRRLAFGPEETFVRHLDYYIAGWEVPEPLGPDGVSLTFNVPGRMASVANRTAMVVFSSRDRSVDYRDVRQQKALVRDVYSGLGWHVPELLAGLDAADDLYFDAISRVRAPAWAKGRVALLGDAAWGVTLGGMGVGTGLVGAHVLASELAAATAAPAPAATQVSAALASYEERMRPYAGRWQKHAHPGKFLAPRTRHGLWIRNTMFSKAFVQRKLLSSTESFADGTDLLTDRVQSGHRISR